jgi:hypothetical protein
MYIKMISNMTQTTYDPIPYISSPACHLVLYCCFVLFFWHTSYVMQISCTLNMSDITPKFLLLSIFLIISLHTIYVYL